jgi:DNA-directed RNA polymerase II subunit RPB1
MTERGFSVGFRDCLVEDDSIIESAMNTIETRVDAIRRRPGFVDPIKQARHLENSEVAELANATAIGNKLATQLLTKYHNRFTDMSRSGSKGSDVNLAQIASAVGQQMVNGRRPQPQLANGTRTLAYFPPNDTSPESRGFVRHCYLIGLTVSEFFMHTMGGREGLTDSALKTAETGYIQRKLVKTTEDLATYEDGTDTDDNGFVSLSASGARGIENEESSYDSESYDSESESSYDSESSYESSYDSEYSESESELDPNVEPGNE